MKKKNEVGSVLCCIVLSFSSCLDTNSESAYDGIALVTVTGDEFLLAINYTQMEVESWFLQLLI